MEIGEMGRGGDKMTVWRVGKMVAGKGGAKLAHP